MHPTTLTYKPPDPEVVGLIRELGGHRSEIATILRALHAARGQSTPHLISEVARELHLPDSHVHGIATFYSLLTTPAPAGKTIRICDGPHCRMRGADDLMSQIQSHLDGSWTITRTSCLGLCDRAPAALVRDSQVGPLQLQNLDRYEVGWCGEISDYSEPRPERFAFCSLILKQRPTCSSPPLPEVRSRRCKTPCDGSRHDPACSGGFRTARPRWSWFPGGPQVALRGVAIAQHRKYVVCNADESEPLSFKDRVILELCPQLVLEGMAIVAYAVGAEAGYVYIRGEYGTQVERLLGAIDEAEDCGWLGSEIGGTEFSFPVHVHQGAGAYICGEETALLESLAGNRGEPRVRPPFPTEHGYRGQPTVVSNVETLAAVPKIIARGADWYRGLGNPEAPGTKLYTLLGEVNRPGLFEAPLRLTLRQIIDTFGEGMRNGSSFRFALTGGAAGTLVPPTLLDVPIDYDSAPQGVALGSGGMLICDQSVNPLRMVRELVRFFELESCGKCTPCRIGTHEARRILDRMLAGESLPADRTRLSCLADLLQATSLCGLGMSVRNPIQSALQHFPDCFTSSEAPKRWGVDL